MKKNLTLVQMRHNYASENGEGLIHLPVSILSVAARMFASQRDIKIVFRDENFLQEASQEPIKADIIGLSIVGAPYIPEAINFIRDRIAKTTPVLLGGQGISGLSSEEFKTLFSTNTGHSQVFNGNNDKILTSIPGFSVSDLSAPEETSLIPAYEQLISEADMKKYLEHEFSLYLAQGCRHNCGFCQAKKGRPEVYKNLEIVEKELEYLVEKAEKFGLSKLSFYVSNLDLFQTPDKLAEFAKKALYVQQKYGIRFEWRGLATAHAFMQLYKSQREVLKLCKEAGLVSVGFGVDGATAEVWKSIGKGHNLPKYGEDEQRKVIDAIKHSAELDISPELLMVLGHPTETRQSLQASLDFTKKMIEFYGAIPRPHVAKWVLPGTNEWTNPANRHTVQMLLSHPEYFQALDYTALPSELTHSDPVLRALVEEFFLKFCALPGNTTPVIYPNTPDWQGWAKEQGTTIQALNEGKFDR